MYKRCHLLPLSSSPPLLLLPPPLPLLLLLVLWQLPLPLLLLVVLSLLCAVLRTVFRSVLRTVLRAVLWAVLWAALRPLAPLQSQHARLTAEHVCVQMRVCVRAASEGWAREMVREEARWWGWGKRW